MELQLRRDQKLRQAVDLISQCCNMVTYGVRNSDLCAAKNSNAPGILAGVSLRGAGLVSSAYGLLYCQQDVRQLVSWWSRGAWVQSMSLINDLTIALYAVGVHCDEFDCKCTCFRDFDEAVRASARAEVLDVESMLAKPTLPFGAYAWLSMHVDGSQPGLDAKACFALRQMARLIQMTAEQANVIKELVAREQAPLFCVPFKKGDEGQIMMLLGDATRRGRLRLSDS